MPLVICTHCELPAYTAARWSTRDDCARCGQPLTPPRQGAEVLRVDTACVAYSAPERRLPG